MIQKVIRSGNSLAVTIPKKFVQTLGIRKGDNVKIEKRVDRGQLILHFSGVQQMALTGSILAKRASPKGQKE